MIFPAFEEVINEFNKRLNDREASTMCAKKFVNYNNYYIVDECWTVKKGKKRYPMKDWKAAVRTFIRNINKYNPDIKILIASNKIFKDEEPKTQTNLLLDNNSGLNPCNSRV